MFAAASKVTAHVAPRAYSLRRGVPSASKHSGVVSVSRKRGSATTTHAGKDEDLMEQLLAMLGGGGGKSGIVSEKDALPGRQEEMRVTDTHFVLGNSIKTFPDNLQTCVFATGCFWGTEKMFWRVPGVFSTSVGYVGGFTQNPTYEETCSGRTGHTEAVQVAWDPTVVSFADLLAMHWTSHDPTQGNRQGNDSGTQYRSGVYCSSQAQKEMAMASADVYDTALKLAGHPRNVITSEINGPGDNCVYYFAEDYHQQYLAKPGARYVLGLSQSQTQFAAPGRGATIIQRKCTTGNSFKYITRRLFYRSW
jgi:peptide-methionine (S)-S-oxide reductase